MEKITKESVANLSEIEKEDLFNFLIEQGVDPVYVNWLIYDRDFNDVVEAGDIKK